MYARRPNQIRLHRSDRALRCRACDPCAAGRLVQRTARPALCNIVGVGGGQLLSALIPMMAGVGNNVDIGALASQAVGGGVAGAIVAAIIGLIKNKMAS